MNKLENFWAWFTTKADYIYDELDNDTDEIALLISEELHKIHPDLAFEIPFDKEENKRVLIISADGLYHLFDTVIELVKIEPQIDNWKILAFRPRLSQRNQIIDLADITLDYHDVFFEYTSNGDFTVTAYIKGYDGKDNRYVHLYFLLLDSLIGEFDAVTLINKTTVLPYEEKEGLLAFPLLLDLIDDFKKI